MILIWHDRMFDSSSEKNLVEDRMFFKSKAYWNPIKYIQWVTDNYEGSKDGITVGKHINSMIDDVKMSGSASLDVWTATLTLPLPINRLLFNELKDDINDNNPSVIGLWGLDNWSGSKISHFMPVIGYKIKTRKVFNIDTVLFDETYIFCDTTWGYKSYWRFDWYSSPFEFQSRIKVKIN